ncbi:hypothetical protein Hypma_009954 [Hypsizygus marmoreus]|uniref:BCAS3 WD40 domain-containing protein n=1 Tax=Hypsizygus marmoreus TaxID=39966 RepID=A0A369JRV8_HYPMA|nr:hypothetical protein Hypma_009954 [Hypsizygus marmoreus]
MPTRSTKNGRSGKSSRHQSPRVKPSPLPAAPDPVATSTPPAVDLLVDFAALDPFGQDVGADQAIVGVFDTFDADAGHSRPENSDEPTAPRSPSPQWNEIRSSHPHNTQRFLDQPQPVLAQLNTFNLRTPSPTLNLLDSVTADDGDDGDAIPIPVPRSQGSPVSSPVPTFPPRSPLIEVRSPNSYGYGHVSPRSPPTPASTPSTARPAALARPGPTWLPPPVSTISTTASPSSNRRFAAPLPFTRIEKESVAPPVVDLGTAGRSGGLLNRTGGEAERRERGEGRRGDEVVLWTRWDVVKLGSKSRRLLFVGTNTSLQVWDCTLTPSPTEVLHVRSSDLLTGEAESGTVVHAAVLPPPHEQRRGTKRVEGGDEAAPLIGVAFDTGTFLVYSLKTHRVVRRVEVVDNGSRIERFEANERFIVVGTTNPPSLYVLSSNSLDTLHVIGQDKVLPYLSPPTPAPSASGSAGGLTTSSAVSMLSSAFAGALSGLTSGSGPAALSHGEHMAHDEDTIYDEFTASSTSHTLYNNNAIYNPHHVSLPPPGPRLGTVSPEFDRRRDHLQDHHLHPHRPPSEHDRPHPPPYPSAHQHQHHHHAHHESPTQPHAVYALSHRLLAYASTTPSTSIPSTIPPRQASTSTSSSPGGTGSRNAVGGLGMGSGVAGLPSTHAELGTAALRVGGSVLSGMRTLGGLAVSAARSRVGGSGVGGERSGNGSGSGVGRFFSRSAPEGVVTGGGWGRGREAEERERGRDRRYSNTSSSPGTGAAYRHHVNPTSEGRFFVTVVDLTPLAGAPHDSSPTLVAEFMVSKDKQITRLAFSSDGCMLIVVPRDGHTLQTFQIRPIPPYTPFIDTPNDDTRAKQHSGVGPPAKTSPPWHVYNLRRGRTSAVVEGVQWARDGRWIAIGTRKRTVHVFGVNPYGGKTDQRSHLEGRVRNVDELVRIDSFLRSFSA